MTIQCFCSANCMSRQWPGCTRAHYFQRRLLISKHVAVLLPPLILADPRAIRTVHASGRSIFLGLNEQVDQAKHCSILGMIPALAGMLWTLPPIHVGKTDWALIVRGVTQRLVNPLLIFRFISYTVSFPPSMQFIAFTLLSLAASLFCATSTSATPIKETRDYHMCHPNFEGAGVSVTNSADEWGTSSASVPRAHITNFSHRGSMLVYADFRFEQDGQDPSRYIIKDIDHNELVASVWHNQLALLHQDRQDPTQLWNVVCDECRTNISQTKGQVAVGCQITSVQTGYCVTNSGVRGEALFLAPCDGRDRQNFDFWTPIDI